MGEIRQIWSFQIHREEIDAGGRLNDQHMNNAQAMIKSQFPLRGYNVRYSKQLDSLYRMNYRLSILGVIIGLLPVPCCQKNGM